MKLFPKFYSSTSKFTYFPDDHHLLIKVHILSLFPVHLGPQDCNRWLNKVDRTQLKWFSKFNCSTKEFPYFHEVHHLHIEVQLLLILPVHLGPPRWLSLFDCGGIWLWYQFSQILFLYFKVVFSPPLSVDHSDHPTKHPPLNMTQTNIHYQTSTNLTPTIPTPNPNIAPLNKPPYSDLQQ